MSRQWVLLRGLAREQAHWGEFKNLLQESDPTSEVICLDHPGCGVYHRLSCPHKINAIAEFAHSQLKGPKPTERYLVAISLGGMVGVELTRLYPKSFDGMVIINSSFKNLSPVHHRLQLQAVGYIFKAATAANLDEKEMAVLGMVSHRPDKPEIAREWAQIARQRPVSPKNFFRQLIAAALYELPQEKPNMPILVLTSEGDRMVNPDCSRRLAEKWAVPIEVHPSGGHELCLDDPEWVVEQIKKFFAV